MDKLWDSLTTLFSKLVNVFDVFDFSYFVSGAVCLAALMYWTGKPLNGMLGRPPEAGRVALAVLGCYVLGLVCFALGRPIRQLVVSGWAWARKELLHVAPSTGVHGSRYMDSLTDVIEFHGLQDDLRGYILPQDDSPERKRLAANQLYAKMWADLRQQPSLQSSLSFLNNMWVRTATYDGLSFALIVWVVVLWVMVSGWHMVDYPHFDEEDITNAAALNRAIMYGTDGLSRYLKPLLEKEQANAPAQQSVREARSQLVSMLNGAVEDPKLSESQQMKGILMSHRTRAERSCPKSRRSCRVPLVTLNRHILEDAHPGMLQQHPRPEQLVWVYILLFGLTLCCMREATRSANNQVTELIATYACWRKGCSTGAGTSP